MSARTSQRLPRAMRTVSARLGLVVGMCVLTVVLVVAGMAHRAGKIDAQIRGILEDSTIARDVRDMRTATAHNVATAIQLITTQEASLRAGIAKRNVETARGIDSTLARLDAGLAGDDEHRLYREAQLLQEEIRRVRAELLLAEPGLQDVSEEIEKQLVPIVARYLAATGALTDLVDARLAAGVQARVAELDREALTMSAISVVAMLVFAALALRITRGIVARIRDATAAADAVATGDLSRPISAGGSDEIGQLLAALLRMQEGLRSIVT
ncbi:MAG: methyl-accepting chemotaxis protein, partial [Burkholderiaceae bacterium]|nr:methyl-accepting chemotaxis protein [Burkholderiaceae bacterium]